MNDFTATLLSHNGAAPKGEAVTFLVTDESCGTTIKVDGFLQHYASGKRADVYRKAVRAALPNVDDDEVVEAVRRAVRDAI